MTKEEVLARGRDLWRQAAQLMVADDRAERREGYVANLGEKLRAISRESDALEAYWRAQGWAEECKTEEACPTR